jgi:hypothetical protein
LTICDTAAAPSAETALRATRQSGLRSPSSALTSPIATQAGASVVAIEVPGTDESEQSLASSGWLLNRQAMRK